MSNNITTWEFLSWSKISYMKVWPKRYGSPFAQGKSSLENLKLYFWAKSGRKQFISWKYPQNLPDIAEEEIKKHRGLRYLCCYLKY